jgi:uncharacterized protein with HEPN domain
MSKRNPADVIEDILSYIQMYSNGITFESFSSNFMMVEACLYNFQIIGEAVNHISPDVVRDNPQIPWSAMKGMRNRLIHEYFGTDIQLVWDVIVDQLPGLKTDLQKLFKGLA